jgi:predicted RNA-binding protein with PIN domain
MAESVVLVPDLPETTVQIGQRLREIRETLGELSTDTEAPDLAAALIWRLKNAHLGKQADEDLAQLHDILELDLVREILGPKMHGRLKQLEKTRQDLTQEPTALDASLDASRPADFPVEREVWDLAAKLQQYPPASVWLFVDGYNAIRRVHDLHKLEQERGLAAARDRFCALCRRCAHQFGHFEIVFDGVESTAATESCAGLRIVYSRSAGESQNADEHLVRRLRALNGQPEVVWLVTDDFGLRERVINHCDAFVPPVLLYRFLTAHT